MEEIKIIEIGMENILLIKPLWEKLRLHHMEVSSYFPERPAGLTFESRMKEILKKAETGKVRIDIAKESDNFIGYCISSISSKNEGEIDSIFIESDFRGHKIGDRLMKNALAWMDDNKAENININVMYGNDSALPFYSRYGFYPRSYILYKK